MKLERLQRWHWAILAVIVGIALAQTQLHWMTSDPLTQGNFIDDPQRFESWLLRQTNGRPWLADVVVHPGRGASASRFVVTAKRVYDSAGATTVVPIAFVPAQPYKPQIGLDYLNSPAATKAIEKFNASANPTILDYLAAARTAAGVTYRYAWWEEPWKSMAAWIGGSLLVIAGLWPTLINLLVYHRLTRPPRERGIDLSKVKAPQPATPVPTTDHLEDLEREMESRVEGFAPVASPPEPATTTSPRVLAARELEPVALEADRDPQEFGAKPDDYYPTAKRRTGREDA